MHVHLVFCATCPVKNAHLIAGSQVYKDRVPIPGSFVPKLVEAKIKLPGQEAKSLTDLEIVAQAYTMIIAGSASLLLLALSIKAWQSTKI